MMNFGGVGDHWLASLRYERVFEMHNRSKMKTDLFETEEKQMK